MRLLALIKKEALAIRNDRRSMFVIIVPPLLQILIFAFSVTLEVKNLNLAILNLDGSSYAKEVITKLESAKFIKSITMVKSYEEGKRLITNQKVLAFLVIPKNFSKGENLALVMDGRYSNSAQIANGYIEQAISGLSIDARNFYNPNLDNFWWIVPNLSCSILMVMSIVLTSLSISREREVGTFDQIIVSPLSSFEILLGKLLPAFLISLALSSVVLFIAYFFFKVPIVGSLWLLYLGTAIFIFCVCSIGLFISVFSNTQQQAILGAFVFLLPSFMLSGFATPIENMPSWLQPVSYFVPLTYHITFVKGVLLKDISFTQSLEYILPMAVFGIVIFMITLIFFRRSILR